MPSPIASVSLLETCRQSVAGIQALQRDHKVIQPGENEDYPRPEPAFDPNGYFTVLDHLSLQQGYALDYVVQGSFLGANPVIYARKVDQKPYATFDEFPQVAGSTGAPSDAAAASPPSYLDFIQIDGTPEGYLQFVLLELIGEQFYMSWHGFYNDAMIMCDLEVIDALQADLNGFNITLPDEVRAQAAALDYTPTVLLDDQTARVRLVTASKWGGFVEQVYTLDRDFPHKLLDVSDNVLVEYDCGIMF